MIIARFLLPTLLIVSSISASAAKSDQMDYGRILSAMFANSDGQTTLDGKGCAANNVVPPENAPGKTYRTDVR